MKGVEELVAAMTQAADADAPSTREYIAAKGIDYDDFIWVAKEFGASVTTDEARRPEDLSASAFCSGFETALRLTES